jgi:N6-L-threonylcarbamoyladenine synthase
MAVILGIESSCDETAAAVVRDGEAVLSNVVYSQIATHAEYGGVVPELASREHLRAIVPVVRTALKEAGLQLADIDALAVTQGPGLAGALLVGITYAKAVGFALEKPVIAVNHLEGHIHAVLLEQRQSGGEEIAMPALALVVSGGHTHLFTVSSPAAGNAAWRYHGIGHTLDDAAGEAFDKVAKLLGLSYPGGPIIEELAHHGNATAVRFPPAQIKVREKQRLRGDRPQETEASEFNFSFSGIKTAVLRYVEQNGMGAGIEARRLALRGIAQPGGEDFRRHCDQRTLDLIASFQHSVIEDLVGKTITAAEASESASLIVTGGVAANSALRRSFEQRATRAGLAVYFPSRKLSTDNAAMIAAAAYPKLVARDFADPEFSAEAGLKL